MEVEQNPNTIDFSDMVSKLVKSGKDIIEELTPARMHILHMAVGVSGEAGELLDAIKKVAIYDKAPDRENIVEELGDLEFYMEGLRQAFSITREETITYNKKKLAARYKGYNYSNQAAQARADKS
jgi:NTP pyrophosphatase (non-canonical NTP hydrolase)